jgi:hypothetical protein
VAVVVVGVVVMVVAAQEVLYVSLDLRMSELRKSGSACICTCALFAWHGNYHYVTDVCQVYQLWECGFREESRKNCLAHKYHSADMWKWRVEVEMTEGTVTVVVERLERGLWVLCCVVLQVDTSSSEEHIVSVFRVCLVLQPTRTQSEY